MNVFEYFVRFDRRKDARNVCREDSLLAENAGIHFIFGKQKCAAAL
jgi:hypothetical protein